MMNYEIGRLIGGLEYMQNTEYNSIKSLKHANFFLMRMGCEILAFVLCSGEKLHETMSYISSFGSTYGNQWHRVYKT